MLALILGAVRTRTAQAVTVLVLTALAAAVAFAGPWYGIAASARAAAADVAAAPAAQRILSIRQIVTIDGDPRAALDTFAAAVGAEPEVLADVDLLDRKALNEHIANEVFRRHSRDPMREGNQEAGFDAGAGDEFEALFEKTDDER